MLLVSPLQESRRFLCEGAGKAREIISRVCAADEQGRRKRRVLIEGVFLCGSLRISAFSALKCFFSAEIADIRRGPRVMLGYNRLILRAILCSDSGREQITMLDQDLITRCQ